MAPRIAKAFAWSGAGALAFAFCLALLGPIPSAAQQQGEQLDPAQWGEDHVGKNLPDYLTGDECLFCHRSDIGPTWDTNRHGRTVRFAAPGQGAMSALEEVAALEEFASEVNFLMGGPGATRFLKRAKGYGKLDIATVRVTPAQGGDPHKLLNAEDTRWDTEKFASKCAGCHATAVETESAAFGAFSLDCFSCHGEVELDHANDTKLIYLSRKRRDEARIVASVCGQCHLRGGESRSTGRPYPDQYVPGDNLFKDYEVDFSEEFIAALNPGDRHVYRNVRDIVVGGEKRLTCMSCHEIHLNSSQMHAGVRWSGICADCHSRDGPREVAIDYEVHSALCEY